MTRLPATYLFVPGNRSDRFDNALRSGADAVVLDLEDAVTPNDKAAARDAIRNWYVPEHECVAQVVIRINDETTAWFEDDLMVLRATGCAYGHAAQGGSARPDRTGTGGLA